MEPACNLRASRSSICCCNESSVVENLWHIVSHGFPMIASCCQLKQLLFVESWNFTKLKQVKMTPYRPTGARDRKLCCDTCFVIGSFILQLLQKLNFQTSKKNMPDTFDVLVAVGLIGPGLEFKDWAGGWICLKTPQPSTLSSPWVFKHLHKPNRKKTHPCLLRFLKVS